MRIILRNCARIALFVSQRHQRIDFRGTTRGQPAGEKDGEQNHNSGGGKCRQIERRDSENKVSQE